MAALRILLAIFSPENVATLACLWPANLWRALVRALFKSVQMVRTARVNQLTLENQPVQAYAAYSVASMADLEALEEDLVKCATKIEKLANVYSEAWTSLHNELRQELKEKEDKDRTITIKQVKLAFETRSMKAASSSDQRLATQQKMEKYIDNLAKLKIEDNVAVHASTSLDFDKASSEAEAQSKEEMFLSSILNLDLQHCESLGILSSVYQDGEELIPYHIVTSGKDPCDIADELWKFVEECSTEK